MTKLHYVEAVLRAVRDYQPPVLSVEIDGAPIDGTAGFVLISNAVGYGGVFRLSQEARLDDGRLEVYLFPSGRPLELVGAALRGVVSQVAGGACKMVPARSVKVSSPEPVPYQVDGDLKGRTPVEVALTGVQYKVLVP
jgi:diacylglycerol kinase family enzyme